MSDYSLARLSMSMDSPTIPPVPVTISILYFRGVQCLFNYDSISIKRSENTYRRNRRRVHRQRKTWETSKKFIRKLENVPVKLKRTVEDNSQMYKRQECICSICSGEYDCDYTPFINYRDTEKQRCHSDLFLLKSPNYCKSRDSFFFRTQRVVNNLPIDINFGNPVGLKNRLLSLMHQKLREKFNEDNICTWKICCDCTNCLPLRCV